MSGVKLYVDDLRRCPEGWTLARTITTAINYLFHGRVAEISLDHDICFVRGGDIRMHKETFMPVCQVLIMLDVDNRPSKVRIHTANVDAGWMMYGMLEKAGYQDITYEPGGDPCTQNDVEQIKKEL